MTLRVGLCGGVQMAGLFLFLLTTPSAMAIPTSGYRPSWDYSWISKRNGVRNVIFGAGAILAVTIALTAALGSGSGQPSDNDSSTAEPQHPTPQRLNSADHTNADIMAWVVDIVSADGTINSHELEWLAEFSEKAGVPWNLVSQMIGDVRAGSLRLPEPASEEEALDWLHTLIGSALVDGTVNTAEGKVLMIMASHLKMSKASLLEYIQIQRQPIQQQEGSS